MPKSFKCVECGETDYAELELCEGLDKDRNFVMVVLCDNCHCDWVVEEKLRYTE